MHVYSKVNMRMIDNYYGEKVSLSLNCMYDCLLCVIYIFLKSLIDIYISETQQTIDNCFSILLFVLALVYCISANTVCKTINRT